MTKQQRCGRCGHTESAHELPSINVCSQFVLPAGAVGTEAVQPLKAEDAAAPASLTSKNEILERLQDGIDDASEEIKARGPKAPMYISAEWLLRTCTLAKEALSGDSSAPETRAPRADLVLLEAWIRGCNDLIESGVATSLIAVCPVALRRICEELIGGGAEATECSLPHADGPCGFTFKISPSNNRCLNCGWLVANHGSAVETSLPPKEPPPGLLMSMALRADHGLGCPGYYDQPMLGGKPGDHAKRIELALTEARKQWEEVIGLGFYQSERAPYYENLQKGAENGKGD